MAKKYRHKKTSKVVIERPTAYYSESEAGLPKWVVENSDDWEEVAEGYLFTTYDGVKIYKGMKTIPIYESDLSLGVFSYYSKDEPHSLYFSTERAALDYLNLHAPRFSKKEIIDILEDKFLRKSLFDFTLEEVLKLFNCKDE